MLEDYPKDRLEALDEMLSRPAEALPLSPVVASMVREETDPAPLGRVIELLGYWGDQNSLDALRLLINRGIADVGQKAAAMIQSLEKRAAAVQELEKILKPAKQTPQGPGAEAAALLEKARKILSAMKRGGLPQRARKQAVERAAEHLDNALTAGDQDAVLIAIQRLNKLLRTAAKF